MAHVTRLQSNFRLRNDVIDNITPKNVVQRDISAPAGEWKPARWLPIQFEKANAQVGADAFVISSGKVVALDAESRVVPAGMRLQLGGTGVDGVAPVGAAAALVLTYTALDNEWGVIDLVTGAQVVPAGAGPYTGLAVARALVERGLVPVADLAGVADPPVADADVTAIINAWISRPVGVAAYDYHVYGGLPEDGDQTFTNYQKQHLVQFLTEVQMQVPQLVASQTIAPNDDFDAAALNALGSTVAVDGDFVRAGEFWNAANVSLLLRYGALTAASPVVALGLNPEGAGVEFRVARNTLRTPFTTATAGVLVRERTAATAITAEGDWFLDAEVGVLFLHAGTWATLVAGAVVVTFTYFYYEALPTAGQRMIHFDGPAHAGGAVTYDVQSNFIEANAALVPNSTDLVGRVLRVERQPLPLLTNVKTAFNLNGIAATAQMPGSATLGFTDLITLSPEVVADQVVIVNVRV